jgi:hypothetical protein
MDRGRRLEVELREFVFTGGCKEDQMSPLRRTQPVGRKEEEAEDGQCVRIRREGKGQDVGPLCSGGLVQAFAAHVLSFSPTNTPLAFSVRYSTLLCRVQFTHPARAPPELRTRIIHTTHRPSLVYRARRHLHAAAPLARTSHFGSAYQLKELVLPVIAC